MSDSVPIHSWPCSYYLESRRRWIPGKLSLTPSSIQFRDESGRLLLRSRLSGIDAVRKESSHFIFSSVTVLEKGTKHWFGSLIPNRNAVFNVLEHFWRERLLSNGGAGAGAAPERSKGKELAGMLEGSRKSLEGTARVLQFQGEQFDSILCGLQRIEGDMDAADRLLTELESPSWWPFSGKLWKTPLESKPKEASPRPDPEKREAILLRIPAVVTRGTDPEAEPGTITLLPSALEIRDGRSRLVRRFASRDVDEIRVHNPYEIRVRQRFLGKPDDSYRLLSAGMPRLVPILESRFPGKLEFLEDAAGLAGTGKRPRGDLGAA
ncbi:SNP47 protein, partial [Ptilonorhynchus violaceus]|nr:SNP47 protein [Ptilonorhynchus violaceus]